MEQATAGCRSHGGRGVFSVAAQFPSNDPSHILAPGTYHSSPNGFEFCGSTLAELAS
jgi:hypothetical protein